VTARVLVVGAGTAGCAFAGTLAAMGLHEVVLIEAGPDYGPFDALRWPAELLDSRRLALSHDWGLVDDGVAPRRLALDRARVVGGCSAHNGCCAIRGPAEDYRAWADLAGPEWRPEALAEEFAAVEEALSVRKLPAEEITPFQRDCLAAAIGMGLPKLDDVSGMEQRPGVGIWSMNKRGGIRWNAAFAFLDPCREGGRLTVLDRTEVECLRVEGKRVVGLRGRRDGETVELEGDLVVLAAGAYGSPMLLQASGIGDSGLLEPAGIACRHHLPGVGRGLQDHPSVVLRFRASNELEGRMDAHEAGQIAYDEGVIAILRSSRAGAVPDLHLIPAAGWLQDGSGARYWELGAALLSPRSRGLVRPKREADGTLRFAIEHHHLSDPEGHDLACLVEGVARVRELAGSPPLAAGLEEEISPGAAVRNEALTDWVRENVQHYWHPAASCAMGRAPEAGAVVDGRGRVHGLEGCLVADCSIMPGVPAANTNLPAAMLGRRLARLLAQNVEMDRD